MIEDGADYDGVIIENVDDTGSYYKNAPENVGTDYITFNSQQFKRADNLNPTQDRDIRYSKAEDAEYLELAQEPEKNKAELQRMVDEAAEAAMPDSAIRDKEGKLRVVYHGSRAVFSVFDLTKTGKASTESKVGFWFTDKESFARAFANDIWYGDGDEAVVYDAYLNIRNPYIYTSTAISKEQSEQREREIKTANEKISQLGKKYDIDSFLGREEALSKNGRFWMMLRVHNLDSFETEYDAYAKMFGIEGTEAEKAQMRADVAEYQKLVEELKKLDERRIAETYTDAYENFRTSIYKYAGMDAEDANFGGLGKVLPDAENVIKRFVSDLKAEGYDGIVIRDTRYDKTYGGGDQFVAFDSEQIKSAEPVTYDDEGNVIPLSERFNSENADIRYSELAPSPQADAYAEMRRQLAEANRKLAEARGQLKKTPQPTVRKDDSRKLARDIIKRYGSNANVESISNAIENLGNLIVRGSDEQGDATVERVSEAAADIMYGIISTSDSVYDEDELALHKEIRDAIRSTPLYVSKYEKADVGDAYGSYNEFRKRNMGKLTTTNNAKAMRVDVFYQEMCERFPWAFDPNITNQAEQINELIRVAESELKPTYNIAEESEAEATDLIFRIIGDVRQVETYADRAAKRLNLAIVHERNVAANARDRARAKVAKLEEQLREKNRKMNELRKQKNRVIENIREEQRVEKERERERMQRREAEERLLRLVQRMNNTKLSKPNRAYFEQYFGDIYTIARSVTGQKLAQVADVEKRYKALSDPDSEYYDPNFIGSPRMEAYFAQYDKSTYIADMTDEQLGDYIYALLELDYMQREQNRLIKAADRSDVRMQAYNVIADVDFTRGVKENRVSQFADWMIRDVLGAVNTIRRYTGYNDYDPLYQRTLDLSHGEMDAAKYAIDSEAMFDPLLNNKKATRTFSGRNAEEIEIAARAVLNGDRPINLKITPAMRTALYMHLQNDDNMRHIADGGIVIPNVELLKKGKISDAYAKGTKVKFEKSELRKIVAGMSDFEIEFAKTAAKYFDDVSAKSISEVYEALHGVPPKMVGGKYFPIAVVPSATGKADVSAEQMLNAYEGGGAEIMNPGWLKERVSSKMPILLVPVDTVVNRAIQNHSRYVGLAIPLTNFNKVWNASLWGESKRYNSLTKTEETSMVPTISVKDAVADKWGAKAVNTINDFVDQISGRQRRTNASWFAKLRSNYAGAVLTMNPATALKQIPSGVAAAYIVGYKALGKAATPGLSADTSFIDDMTAAYTMRKKGYSSQELGELASNKRKLPAALSWIVGADLATTKVLKRAAVFYVRDNFKSLQVGSEAYKQKVVDVYEKIINETQPTYDVSYRAAALRSNNEVKRALHMFKTQPYKNFGIVYTAFGEMFAKRKTYREANRYATDSEESKTYAEEAKKAYNEAKKGVARAVTSQAISAMMIASIVAAWDMFTGGKKKYKDEDGDVTLLSFLKGLGINFASTGAGAIPFGSTTLEYAEQAVDKIVGKDIFGTTAYEFSIPEVDMLNNLLTSAADLTETIFSGDIKNPEKAARTVLKDAGDVLQAFGVPLKNVEKLTKAVLTNAFRASGKYVGEYYALRVMGTVDAYKQAHYDNLYKAYKNDKAQYQEIYNNLIDNGVTEKAIKDAMESRMKSEQGVSSVKELESRYLSPMQQKEYDKTVAAVKRSNVYYESDSSDRARLNELAYEVVAQDGWKNTAAVKDNNLTATEYVLYKLAIKLVDEPNSKGDYGTYTKEETEKAIEMVKGN